MVLPRPTALRGFAPARLYRSTARTTIRSRVQIVARRGYASGGDHGHASSSDVPWLISAVAVTLPSCYFLWPEASHADAHGAHGGHGEHDEEHEEEHAEGAEEDSDESKDEPQRDSKEESTEAPKEESDDASKEDKSDEASKEDAAPAEDSKDDAPKEDSEESQDKGEAQDEQAQDSESSKPDKTDAELTSNKKVPGVQFKGKTSAGDDNNEMQDLRKREPDSKGAFKKRIDSAYQTNLGEGPDKDEDGKPTGSTSRSVGDDHGSIDKKQMGLTNTPTRHSSAIHDDPEKSKKGEGTPETAKSMGTVAHDRPAR